MERKGIQQKIKMLNRETVEKICREGLGSQRRVITLKVLFIISLATSPYGM